MTTATMFNPDLETMSRDRIADWQAQRLRAVVQYVWDRNPKWRARLAAVGVEPGDIRRWEDHAKLPTMVKDDLRDGYPDGFSCVGRDKIVEMHMSSGSTGTPVVMLYTPGDLAQWGECMARCYMMAGARPADALQITSSMALYNGGFGMYHGARTLGLFVVPTGPGNTARQLKLARDFKTKMVAGVVSYGIRILEEVMKTGERLPDLKIGLFGAESFSDRMRKTLQDGLGIEAFDIYGMTETGGIGTLGQDCPAHDGLHVWEDHHIVEVVDADGRPVEDGVEGELCITTLSREAVPVIRFRTGDLTRVVSRGTCSCGRTHVRIAPISGRLDDMLIIRGVNFFPRQVEQALMEIEGVLPNYRIVIEEYHGVKDVIIHVEADGRVSDLTVVKHLKERLGFTMRAEIFKPDGLPRSDGKSKRVFYQVRED